MAERTCPSHPLSSSGVVYRHRNYWESSHQSLRLGSFQHVLILLKDTSPTWYSCCWWHWAAGYSQLVSACKHPAEALGCLGLPSPSLPSPPLSCPALTSPPLPCPALPSPALPSPPLLCPALPSPPWSCRMSPGNWKTQCWPELCWRHFGWIQKHLPMRRLPVLPT